MIHVNRQQFEKALRASVGHCVAGVVSLRPGVGARGQAAIGKLVQNTLRAKEKFSSKLQKNKLLYANTILQQFSFEPYDFTHYFGDIFILQNSNIFF